MGQLNGNGNTKEPNVITNKYLNLTGLSSFWNWAKQYIANQIPTHLPNPENLTIQGNGTSLGTYNGLEAKTINITPASIGAASAPVTYRTASNETGFYKISINSATAWMLAFRVRVYKGYQYFDIRFSGYNYQSNHWYCGKASLVEGDANITVYMGYDDVNKLWVAIPATQYTGIEIADCVNGFRSTDKSLSELFTITRIDSLSGTTQHTYILYPPSKQNHTHDYLPLSGGTISSTSFCPLVIERSGSTNMAALQFKNSNGILGSIGMNTVYGSLLLHNAAGTESKTILDSSNYSIYALPKSGGTMTGVINSQSIIPKTTNTYDMGTASLKWANIYATTFIGNATGLTSDGTQNSALSRDLTKYPRSKTLFTGGWNTSTGNYATTYGTTLDISYSTWYQRLAFNTTGRIEYFRGINSNNTDDTEATLSKVGDLAYLSDIPTSLKNPYSLTIQGNGTTIDSYDGSTAKTINITPENIGALSKGTDATKVVLGDGSLKPISDFVTGTINETTISYADGILSMNFSDANVISYDNGTLNLTL